MEVTFFYLFNCFIKVLSNVSILSTYFVVCRAHYLLKCRKEILTKKRKTSQFRSTTANAMYGLFTFMSLTVLTPMPGDALRCYHGLSAGTKTECDDGVRFCMIGIFKDSLFFSKMRLCGAGEQLWNGCREIEDGKVLRCYCSTDGCVLFDFNTSHSLILPSTTDVTNRKRWQRFLLLPATLIPAKQN